MAKMSYKNLPYKPVTGLLCDPGKENGTGRCAMGYLLTFFFDPKIILKKSKSHGDESFILLPYLVGIKKWNKICKSFSEEKLLDFQCEIEDIESTNDEANEHEFSHSRPVNKRKYVDAFYMLPKLLKNYEEIFRAIDSEAYDRAYGNITSIIKEWSKAKTSKVEIKTETPIVEPVCSVK